MSQDVFSTIDPDISGTVLATTLDNFKNALMTGLSGTSRPAETDLGGGWIDTTNDPTYWSYRIWTGTADVEVFKIHLSSGIASVALAVEDFSVKKVSADTVGPLMKLVKQRIASNGQVLDGDTVGEIQFIGRADDASNPIVAKIVWVSSDDMTSSAFGGEFAFYSTADNTSTLLKHMRFIDGVMETLVPLKVNSLQLVSQGIATAASIDQLNADKSVVEMTGSTPTDLRGIDSSGDAQTITIHNRSSADVTLKHENGTAAAADRLKLPGAEDFIMIPDSSATLFYSAGDTRWKLKSTANKNFSGSSKETFYGISSWTALSSLVKITAYKKHRGIQLGSSQFIDPSGNAYAWGNNTYGQLGVGDTTPRSSPVAVVGGLSFVRLYGGLSSGGVSSYGLADNGSLYSWGVNNSGQLGDNSVTTRNSPVAVSGGLKFLQAYASEKSAWGITTSGKLYSWGINTHGQLGDASVTPRSVPVAVAGGIKWAKIVPIAGNSNTSSVCGMASDGTLYSWGANSNGQLGLGDVAPRSSPVAVVGGISLKSIYGCFFSGVSFFGLDEDGDAYGWGYNAKGQLGNGNVIPRSSPVAVVGGLKFQELITHSVSESVFGLTGSGVLYSWGDNTNGQLGLGDVIPRSSPVAVLGGLTFSRVFLFKNSVFATTNDGTLYAWGNNSLGVLGLGDVTPRSSPVAVLGGLKFFDVTSMHGLSDDYSILGMTADGTLYSWGRNSNGTLGHGEVDHKSSPVMVIGANSADAMEPSISKTLTVTPGSSYTVAASDGISYFGNTPLGTGVYKIEIEYFQ